MSGFFEGTNKLNGGNGGGVGVTPDGCNGHDTFNDTTVGATPQTRTYRYQNTAPLAITLTKVILGSTTPKLWSTDAVALEGRVLQPGELLTFTVTFTPPGQAPPPPPPLPPPVAPAPAGLTPGPVTAPSGVRIGSNITA